MCDGQSDCQDRSDEMDCSTLMEGCHQRCDNNTRCIPKKFLCDGERDCADGSDEEKCGGCCQIFTCIETQIKATNFALNVCEIHVNMKCLYDLF